MDAAADHAPALADRGQGGRHQLADRCEMIAASSGDGRLARAAGPGRPQLSCEALRFAVAGAREGGDFPALPDRDLRDDCAAAPKP